GEASMVEMARKGRPFLMNVQSNEVTRARMDLYRTTMREIGRSEEEIADAVDQCWIWRNVVVAETDAEAERVGVPAFVAMTEQRAVLRERVYREQGVRIKAEAAAPPSRVDPKHALICGSPKTVAAAFRELDAIGVGGCIMSFRLGPMDHATAVRSLTLFMKEVAPQLR
ncbi:MAG: LLM class flavin-dependent oxidoreductase, partial [Alphaproteobacteria bacterium]|nr:LLM class flavin-dependent oxidoreductase [Alphaproteobacteria bacterium]